MSKAGRAVDVEVVSVTPKKAREWLEDNRVNRRLRPKVVDAYRRDMEEGRWVFTGEPIQISASGALLNGQHRLTALGSSKTRSVDFVVATGLPDEAQSMIDQGVSRNIGDALVIVHGHIKNITLVAAITRWTCLVPEAGPSMHRNSLSGKVTAAEALELYASGPEMFEEAALWATHLRKMLLVSPTAIGYTWRQLALVDREQANEFFNGMVDMEWSYMRDPRKAALRRLQTLVRDPDYKTTLETGVLVVSILTRAWNAWREKEEMESIGLRTRTGIIPPVVPI